MSTGVGTTERVVNAVCRGKRFLKGARRCGKVAGVCGTAESDLAGSIYEQASPKFEPRLTADVGGIEKRGTGGIELGNNNVAANVCGIAATVGLKDACGGWVIGVAGHAGDVDISGGIENDVGKNRLVVVGTEGSGEVQNRIDDQRLRLVVGADFEAESVRVQKNIVRRDSGAFAVFFLEGNRRQQEHFVAGATDRQAAGVIQRDYAGPANSYLNRFGIGMRRNNVVKLNPLLISVIGQIDAGI